MSPSEPTRQDEIPAEVSQWISTQHFGTPIKAFVMEAMVRYYFRWFLLLLGSIGAFIFIVIAIALQTLLSVVLLGLYLLAVALAWFIYFSPSFRRYGEQHTTHVYICPHGMVGVVGGSIVYSYHWAQVQAASLKEYKGGSEYKLQLLDGRQVTFKGMYQPPVEGLSSSVKEALELYRGKPLG